MLAIIIINYKNELKTIDYVSNEVSKIKISYVVLIVNNEASAESNIKLVNELSADLVEDSKLVGNKENKIYILPQNENLGFAKANNLGAVFALQHFNISFLLFSNNDLRFINEDVVERLAEKLASLPKAGLIGPKVTGLDNKNQSPEPYISFFDRYFWLYWLTPLISVETKIKRFKLDYSQKAQEGFHYKIMGSFFLMKASSFVNCGMMDSYTFLYAEEIILSERLALIGESCYYYPQVAILHEHGGTITKYLSQKKSTLALFKSESYYYAKYKNVSALSILIGKISLLFYLKLKKYLN